MQPQFIQLLVVLLSYNLIGHNADEQNGGKKPNIIIIMSDDMVCPHWICDSNINNKHLQDLYLQGFNDAGYHGSDQIPTPNIDALSIFGIALNRYYVAPMCTPSRSSLLTGKYPSSIGMQHFVIPSNQPWGLGLDQKILPEYLKEIGYNTHIIGKWHLGFYEKRYTPLFRGFDSHFGYLGPYIDYFNHSLYDPVKKHIYSDTADDPLRINESNSFKKSYTFQTMFPVSGYDMRKNLSMEYGTKGTYATDLFTQVAVETIRQHDQSKPLFMYLAHLSPHAGNDYDPLQAPEDELAKFAYINDEKRRKYAAMVSRLDTGIGEVVNALSDTGMLANTIVLFFCDNGAPTIGQHSNAGSNHPFRGVSYPVRMRDDTAHNAFTLQMFHSKKIHHGRVQFVRTLPFGVHRLRAVNVPLIN